MPSNKLCRDNIAVENRSRACGLPPDMTTETSFETLRERRDQINERRDVGGAAPPSGLLSQTASWRLPARRPRPARPHAHFPDATVFIRAVGKTLRFSERWPEASAKRYRLLLSHFFFCRLVGSLRGRALAQHIERTGSAEE